MANPRKFNPAYSYAGFQSVNPTRPLPGQQVDNDLANISEALNETVDALAEIRRDDGTLQNGIVTPDSIAPEVVPFFAAEVQSRVDAAAASAAAAAASADTAEEKAAETVSSAAAAATFASNAANSAGAAADSAQEAADAAASVPAMLEGKQDASPNLDAWSALAPSAKQDASDSLTALAGSYVTTKNGMIAALALGASVQLATSLTSITLVAADVPTFLANAHKIKADVETTINLPAGVYTTSSGDIMKVSAANANLRIVGVAPITTSIISVVSVVAGPTDGYGIPSWDVTYQLANAAGIQVGQVGKIKDCVPVPILSGDRIYFRNEVAQNELQAPVEMVGRAATVTGVANVDFDDAKGVDVPTHLPNGRLVTMKGQTRQVAVPTANNASTTGGWSLGASATRGFWASKPNTGTVSTAGTSATLTGAGTAWLSQANDGDMVLAFGFLEKINTVDSNTQITMAQAHNISVSAHSIITPAAYHNGAHEIITVAGNNVTVRTRSFRKPPKNRVSGGEFKAITTVLKQTGTGDGLVCGMHGALAFINNVALQGSRNASGNMGVALQGRYPEGLTQLGAISSLACGDGFAVLNFGWNVMVGPGCKFQARRAAFNDAVSINIWGFEHSLLALRECVEGGSGNIGTAINRNCLALMTDFYSVANAGDNIYCLGEIYAEIPFSLGAGTMGLRVMDGYAHINEGMIALCDGSGIYNSGGKVDASRIIIGANARYAIENVNDGKTLAPESWITCTRGTGTAVLNQGGDVDVRNSGITGNLARGADTTGLGRTNADGSMVYFNGSRDIYTSDEGAITLARNGLISTVEVDNGGRVRTDGTLSAPVLTGVARVNEMANDGSLVSNGAGTSQGFSSINVNGGSRLTFFKHATTTHDVPSIAAGAQYTFDVTVTGATTTNMTATAQSNSLPAGLAVSAFISAADTVRVVVANNSAAAIDPGNATFTVMALGGG